MIVNGIEMEPFLLSVAAKLAHETDGMQAEFFNVFAKELAACCGTKFARDLQATAIARHIDEDSKQVWDIIGSTEDA